MPIKPDFVSKPARGKAAADDNLSSSGQGPGSAPRSAFNSLKGKDIPAKA